MVKIEMPVEDHYGIAEIYEPEYRGVLRDLRDNKGKRPNANRVPEDLDTEGDLERLFDIVSRNDREFGEFTVTDFRKLNGTNFVISFTDGRPITHLEYVSDGNGSVRYVKAHNLRLEPSKPEPENF